MARVIKLAGLTFGETPRIAGLRSVDLITIDCDNPSPPMRDWRIIVRGPSIFLISPPGWTTATQTRPADRDPKGPVVVHEVPRASVFLQWQSDDTDPNAVIQATSKHETPPLGFKPAPIEPAKSILSQIPIGQTGDA